MNRTFRMRTTAGLIATLTLAGIGLVLAQDNPPKTDAVDPAAAPAANNPATNTTETRDPTATPAANNPATGTNEKSKTDTTSKLNQLFGGRYGESARFENVVHYIYRLKHKDAKQEVEALKKLYPRLRFSYNKDLHAVVLTDGTPYMDACIKEYYADTDLPEEERAKKGLSQNVKEFLEGSAPAMQVKRPAVTVAVPDGGTVTLGRAVAAPSLAGEWRGDGWGRVELREVSPGVYEGTYDDTYGDKPGFIKLTWSASDGKYSGQWGEPESKRIGELTARLSNNGSMVVGAFSASDKSKIQPGQPKLDDLQWTRKIERLSSGTSDPTRSALRSYIDTDTSTLDSVKKYRTARSSGAVSEAERAALRKQVQAAFDARQNLLRQEVAEFRQRLERLNNTLQDRDRSKEQIVERRVEELLNPNLRWEAVDETASPKGNYPNPNNPANVPNNLHVVPGYGQDYESLQSFFKAHPQLIALKLNPNTTHDQFLKQVEKEKLKLLSVNKGWDGGATYELLLDNDLHFRVMFHANGQCVGIQQVGNASPRNLDFLKSHPELKLISLDMSLDQFKRLIAEMQPKIQSVNQHGDGGVTYCLGLDDGHQLMVMFDATGKCKGIQRVRGTANPTTETPKANTTANKPSTPAVDKDLKIFHLKNAKAEDIASTLQRLESDDTISMKISTDAASNTLIIFAAPKHMQVIEALILQLDEATTEPKPKPTGTTSPAGRGGSDGTAQPKTSDSKQTATELEGVWLRIDASGRSVKREPDDIGEIVIYGDFYALYYGGSFTYNKTNTTLSRLTLEPDKSPKRIVMKGEHNMRGIYELKDDTLRLNLVPSDDAYPTKFTTEKPEFKRISRVVPQALIDVIDDLQDRQFNKKAGNRLSEGSLAADAKTTPVTVNGICQDPQGKPLADVSVAIMRGMREVETYHATKELHGPTKTAADGKFSIQDLQPFWSVDERMVYILNFSAPNYAQQTVVLDSKYDPAKPLVVTLLKHEPRPDEATTEPKPKDTERPRR